MTEEKEYQKAALEGLAIGDASKKYALDNPKAIPFMAFMAGALWAQFRYETREPVSSEVEE